MGKPNNIWSYVARHKYIITIVIGILLVGVLDENSFRKYVVLNMRLSEVQEELKIYEDKYIQDSLKLSALDANHKGVERIARETYYMKRPNEDVFVLTSDQVREKERKQKEGELDK